MKATMYDIEGKKKDEIDLPKLFEIPIREDLVLKYFLVKRSSERQPYSHDPEAGRKHSASGTISHKRHEWKGHYGRGISRVPRKTMWRRGTQFYWIGAEVSGTRGGRRVHGPVLIKKIKKINKKEIAKALNIVIAATANRDLVIKRYASLNNLTKNNLSFPVVIESKLDNIKTKLLLKLLKNIFGDFADLLFKKKEVRAGKGKRRGRKYKSNAGALLVRGKDEKIKVKGIDVKSAEEIEITDLYPLGRITIYTEKALKELEAKDAP